MLARLIPDRFLLALVGIVALASLLPAQGLWAERIDGVATAAIVLLFFLHGAKLPRAAVIAALAHWRLHLAILGCTFVMFPLLGIALSHALPGLLPPLLWAGILYLCVLPSTVQSSVAFTAMAGGNVAAAVAAASASQLAGIALTPLLAGALLGRHGDTGSLSGVGPILAQLLLPFALGHALRPLIGGWVERHRRWTRLSDQSAILLAVYSAFSAAALAGVWARLSPAALAALAGVCLGLLAIVMLATQLVASAMKLERGERIALVFAGSKKSIVAGVPMARILFPGPDMGVLLLPAMLFHQFQLMACAWLAQRWRAPVD